MGPLFGLFQHERLILTDKAVAVTALRDSYRQAYGGVRTVGLGDAPNDASFLALMDVPVVVRSPYTGTLSALVPDALVTTGSGPHGWAEGVLEILENE
jgi:mannosyl-3-phosphoglycerate phosphatase